MAQTNSPSANATVHRRDGDWLLSYNRRLRNLNAISLRNLSFASGSPSRRRRQTIDDDAVPQTLQSPAKLVALREYKTFNHSRSSTDLRAVAESAVVDEEDAKPQQSMNGSLVKDTPTTRPQSLTSSNARRPEFKHMRRSTLEWTNATAQARQEKLEDVADEHTADVFVTLHVRGVQEPVYISETVHRTMNPSFRQIDWSTCGPGVTRSDQVVLKIWARGGRLDIWRQLWDVTCHLHGLRYFCKNLDDVEDPLPQNAVLFHMVDGIYIAPTDSLLEYGSTVFRPESRAVTSLSSRSLPTSSFDTLLRLAKLDDSIQDALATREKLAQNLEDLLQSHKSALRTRDLVTERRDRLETLEFAKKTVERQLDKARKQHAEKAASLAARRKLMSSDLSLRNDSTSPTLTQQVPFPQAPESPPRPSVLSSSSAELSTLRAELSFRTRAISSQRRRVSEDLAACFPIVPRGGNGGGGTTSAHHPQPLAFTIRGLPLPHADDLDSEPFDLVAAALGHVAHALPLLAAYHGHPLPYPLHPRGSSSTVSDPISVLKTNSSNSGGLRTGGGDAGMRTYPLFSKGVPRFRFEYGVFLLNQDVRILLEDVFRVRVLDARQTLANLKYLFYVATAGDGELPARKAGGVRGLLRRAAAPQVKRLGSGDSGGSTISGSTLQGDGKGDNKGKWNGQGNGGLGDAVGSLRRLGGR